MKRRVTFQGIRILCLIPLLLPQLENCGVMKRKVSSDLRLAAFEEASGLSDGSAATRPKCSTARKAAGAHGTPQVPPALCTV